jgi:MFS family permease
MFGSGVSFDIWQLMVWRFVAGAGSAMYMTGAEIYLVDVSTPETRAMCLETNQMSINPGVSLGPGIGGLIAQGFGLRVPFHVVGVATLFAALYAYMRLPKSRYLADHKVRQNRVATSDTPDQRAWPQMIRSRAFVAVAVVTMMIFFTRGASRQTLIPLIAIDELGMSTGVLDGFFMAASLVMLVLLPIAAFIADRFGRSWAIIPGGLIAGLVLIGLGNVNSIPPSLGLGLMLSIGFGIMGPAPAAFAASSPRPNSEGSPWASAAPLATSDS